MTIGPKKIGEVTVHGKKLDMLQTYYSSDPDRVAICFECSDTGEPYSMLTVNLPDKYLGDNEIFVKIWSEYEHFAPFILEQFPDMFEDTGKRVKTGFVEAAIWKMKTK